MWCLLKYIPYSTLDEVGNTILNIYIYMCVYYCKVDRRGKLGFKVSFCFVSIFYE